MKKQTKVVKKVAKKKATKKAKKKVNKAPKEKNSLLPIDMGVSRFNDNENESFYNRDNSNSGAFGLALAPQQDEEETLVSRPYYKSVSLESLGTPGIKVVVVVASEVEGANGNIKINNGRAAAQAVHAGSKAKLAWVTEQKNVEDAVWKIQNTPINTVILRARDQAELDHISTLAYDKKLLCVNFEDKDSQFYGDHFGHTTAIAFAPVRSYDLVNVTDYLPKW